MSALVKRNLNYIRLLSECKSKPQQKALVETITRDQLKAVIEITYNILQLNVPVSKSDKRKLARKVSVLKQISNRKNSLKQTRILLTKNISTTLLIVKAALPVLLTL